MPRINTAFSAHYNLVIFIYFFIYLSPPFWLVLIEDRWLSRERLREKDGSKTRVENTVRQVNNRSRIRAWRRRRAGWWWCSKLHHHL